MLELRKFVAPEFVFGRGALELAGRYAKNFGARNVLVVTDPGVSEAGWARKVHESLDKEGINYATYSRVSPNPRADEIMEGARFYNENQCDIIIAVGGGSAIDCAKSIGIVTTNKKHVLRFEGIDQVPVPGPPLICIPTTAGTSADVSQFAIVSNPLEKNKIAIVSKTVVPDVSLIDPITTLTMDPYLTACTGIDAMVHAVEAFVSTASSPVMDLHALEAIRLVHNNLLKVLKDPDNMEFREKMMLGSLEAGLAFSNASLGAVHAMAHSLGGFLDMPHGECNAMLLEHVMAFNYPTVSERYDKIGDLLGLELTKMSTPEKRRAIIDEIQRFKTAAGIENTLAGRGVRTSDIPELAQKAVDDPCMVTNPRHPVKRDIEVVYEEAL